MSRRTRDNRERDAAGGGRHGRPNTEMRRLRRQAARRAEHQALHDAVHDDPDAVLIPTTKRATVDLDPAQDDRREPERRRYRVWKTKMWKRRSTERRRRAELEADHRRAV